MPTLLKQNPTPSGVSGTDLRPSAAEKALMTTPSLKGAFRAGAGHLLASAPSRLQERLRTPDMMAYPFSAAVLPTLQASGGQDNRPYYSTPNTSPSGEVLTEAGVAIVGEFNWSVYVLVKNGGTAASVIWGSASSGGAGGFYVRARSSNLIQVVGGGSTLVEYTLADTNWHLVGLHYRTSDKRLALSIDGAVTSSAVVALTFPSGRVALFGQVDLVTGVVQSARGGSLQEFFWEDAYMPDAPVGYQAIKAYLAQRCPTLVLA